MKRLLFISLKWQLVIGLLLCVSTLFAKPARKTPIYVLTDISTLDGAHGEPDDTESLIRLLHYTDRLDIMGIGATYTTHTSAPCPQYVDTLIADYALDYPQLSKHGDFQSPATIHSFLGSAVCGTENIGEGFDTPLSLDLASKIESSNPRNPLWILVWGGPLDLAQALWHLHQTSSARKLSSMLRGIRVYAILDQYDGSGPWIREHFPDLFYITDNVSFRGMYHGCDESLCSTEWVLSNVKICNSALAARYPLYDGGDPWGKVKGLKEGDTPSFLYLLYGDPSNPDSDHWGGRFHLVPGTSHYTDGDKTNYSSSISEVNRWRPAFQSDFSARLSWGNQ